MSKGLTGRLLPTSPKAKWVKPAVGQLKAGAAEIANGVSDDGDGNTIPNDTS